MENLYVLIQVKVPEGTKVGEISRQINKALDEPPCDWGDWEVGAAQTYTEKEAGRFLGE